MTQKGYFQTSHSAKTTGITFRQWLKLQRWRDDRVGDLSRDFMGDTCAKGLRTVASIKRHILYAHEPCDGAREALDEAIFEYVKRTLRGEP